MHSSGVEDSRALLLLHAEPEADPASAASAVPVTARRRAERRAPLVPPLLVARRRRGGRVRGIMGGRGLRRPRVVQVQLVLQSPLAGALAGALAALVTAVTMIRSKHHHDTVARVLLPRRLGGRGRQARWLGGRLGTAGWGADGCC